jgi:dTDP-4-dehydrorhamnose reductase
MRKRLFITGGTGFLGGHLLVLAGGNWEVFASVRSRPPIVQDVRWVGMELADEKRIASAFKSVRPDAVIHAGAMSGVDDCEMQRERALAVNAKSSALLARLCEDAGARMVFVSSDMVFDGEKGIYTESDPARPVNYYGETKRIAEDWVLQNCSNSVCGRAALIYGIPAIGGTSFTYQMMKRLEAGLEVSLFTDQYRSPIPVRSLAAALLELAEIPVTGICNLGGSERIDRYSFGMLVAEAKGYPKSLLKPVSIQDVRNQAARPRDASMDISKARAILKTRLPDCREGIELFLSLIFQAGLSTMGEG